MERVLNAEISDYLVEDKNTHLEHLEDEIINNEVNIKQLNF